MSCVILASCAATKTIDTVILQAPQGTAHPEDTPTTKSWMLSYELWRRDMIERYGAQ